MARATAPSRQRRGTLIAGGASRRRRAGDRRGEGWSIHLVVRVSRYRVVIERSPLTSLLRRQADVPAAPAHPEHMKLIIQIPCFNEEAQLPLTLSRLPRADRRLRRRRMADHRRRLDRPHRRGRARARRRPRRPADQQQGPGSGLPGRPRRRAEARRRRDRQHRRRQPVRGCGHPKARGADSRRSRGHGRRRPPGRARSSTSRRSRSCSSASARGSSARRPRPRSPTPPRASAPTTARRRCRCRPSRSSPTRSRRSSRPASCWSPSTTSRSGRTPKTRESRLFPSTAAYVRRNALSIFRIYSQYEPLKVFWGGGAGDGPCRRWRCSSASDRLLHREPADAARGHVQSLIAGAVLFIAAMLLAVARA